jgi:hypothetical protein
MGLFGNNRRTMSAAQQVAAGGDGVDPNTVPHGDPRNRVFGDGSIGGIVGGIGKVLSYGPFIGMAQEGMNRRRELDDSNMAYKAAMDKHGQTEDPSPTATMQNVREAIDPSPRRAADHHAEPDDAAHHGGARRRRHDRISRLQSSRRQRPSGPAPATTGWAGCARPRIPRWRSRQ